MGIQFATTPLNIQSTGAHGEQRRARVIAMRKLGGRYGTRSHDLCRVKADRPILSDAERCVAAGQATFATLGDAQRSTAFAGSTRDRRGMARAIPLTQACAEPGPVIAAQLSRLRDRAGSRSDNRLIRPPRMNRGERRINKQKMGRVGVVIASVAMLRATAAWAALARRPVRRRLRARAEALRRPLTRRVRMYRPCLGCGARVGGSRARAVHFPRTPRPPAAHSPPGIDTIV